MADPNLLLSRAKSALLARDYQLAAKYYKTLISENPDVVDYRIALGNLYVKAGNDDQALSVFRTVEKSNPENLTVLMAMAGIYRRKKMFDDSVAVLEQALLISNNSPEDYATISYNLGFTYRQMGNNEEAIHCFENVIEQNPKDVLAYNHLGAIHALQGDQNKAIEAYRRGLQFDPNHPILHFNLARSYAEIGETQKALSHYEAALRARPGWLDAIEEYANLLLKNNKVNEAEETVQNALKLNPDDVKMHTSMGNVYNRKSVYDNAEVEFKKALSGDDEYKPALTGLARSLEKQGKHEEAAETISKAQRLNPDDVAVIKQSAEVLLSANFLAAAYEKISRLWEINSNDPQTISLLGQYYIAKGDESKIEGCFDKIQQVAPNYKDVYRDWGARFIQNGDNKRAEKYLKTAIQQNPRDAESMMYLGEIFESQQRSEEALAMYKRASHADSFNELSKKEISKLRGEGVKETNNIDFSDGELLTEPENSGAQKAENNKVPDLLNDTTNPLNKDFEDFGEKTVGEIELAEDSDVMKSPDVKIKNPEIEKSEKTGGPEKTENQDKNDEGKISAVDEGFDFEQFGMEKLKNENPEEVSVASIDDLMQKEDLNRSENPADIEELVDDGAPLDDEDNVDMEFIPDGSELANSSDDNKLVSEDELPDYEEDEEIPDIMSPADWENAGNEDEITDRNLYDEINDLKNKVDEASKIAGDAKDSAQKLMEEMRNLSPAESMETPEEEDAAADGLYVEPEKNSDMIEAELQNQSEDIPEEDSVSEKEEIQAAETQSGTNSPDELMMRRAIDMLPEIVRGIEDRASFFKFKNYLEMFKTLRKMIDFLPELKKQEFMSSKNRILLDYVISKLSGKPGLYATSRALHNSGIIHENPALNASGNDGIELVKEVLENLKRLAGSLDDETLRIALDREDDELMSKLI